MQTTAPSNLFRELRNEWALLSEQSLPFTLDHCSALTAGHLVEAIKNGPRSDELLHQLLSLHQDGEDFAGRVVLQAMLGRADALTRTAAGRGHDPHDSVCAMWTAIATYPLHLTQRVAANLAMNALKAMSAAVADEVPGPEVIESAIHAEQTDGRLDASPISATDEAVTLMLWALDHQVLTRDEVQILAHHHLGDGYRVAAPLGLSPHAARQRRSRAVRKLAAAVSEAGL